MAKRRLQEEDVAELFDIVSRQLQEDRAAIEDIFKELKEHVKGHPDRYVDVGEVLAKLAELKMKQTSQVVEVFKTVEKAVPEDQLGQFNENDLDHIAEEVERAEKKKAAKVAAKKKEEESGS